MPNATVALINLECWCGIPFAAPQSLYNEHLKFHQHSIFCPMGHKVSYGAKSQLDEAREAIERERRRATRLTAELDQTQASLRAQKGVTTKLKKRAANGVCPCCKRHFANLHRHMTGQHPEFVSEP